MKREYSTVGGSLDVESILLVEAFGEQCRRKVINSTDEDLHSVFRERSELMGWLTTAETRALWSMHEAEIDNNPLVGRAQVGLERISVPGVLPAMFQCLSDSLLRFGAVVLGFQVTTCYQYALPDDRSRYYLAGVLNWFNLDTQERVKAVVHFDEDLLGDNDVSTLIDLLQQQNLGGFEFHLLTEIPVEKRVRLNSQTFTQSELRSTTSRGLLVLMPEWTPSAAGWVLARIVYAAHLLGSKSTNYAVRISKLHEVEAALRELT